MSWEFDEHEADDETGQHGEDTERDPASEADHELRSDHAAATRLCQERRSDGLVPVLACDDEYAEHEGEQP